tara:strand:- start:6548 stop:7096 length:549 start_codon:yes stop_codon:yes gene_type:complete
MNKVFYGGGSCSLQGNDIIGLQINFSGAIHITDKTPENFYIVAKNNTILIFSINPKTELTDLFDYKGEFKINRIIAIDSNFKKAPCRFKKVMDFAELLETNAEDLDIISEDLNAGFISKSKVFKTKVDKSIIENLYSNNNLFIFKKRYKGDYHIHLDTGTMMTGASHTNDSKILKHKKSGKK